MKLLCELIANELNGAPVSFSSVSDNEVTELIETAGAQKLLPLAGKALLSLPEGVISENSRKLVKKLTLELIAEQTVRTRSFAEVYSRLSENGLSPCVVKGIVCRSLYPLPDSRPSGDEDLLIDIADCGRYEAALKELGFYSADEKVGGTFFERTFIRGDRVKLEVHTSLFSPDTSSALNDAMGDFRRDMRTEEACGVSVLTLSPTHHLLYLLLHAFKHFIASGFGLRQVCDIALFAEKYGSETDFDFVCAALKTVRADTFAAAVFDIAFSRLGFDENIIPDGHFCLPDGVASQRLLEDIFSGGIYGGGEVRQHSANVTLGAYGTQKGSGSGVLHALFPNRKYMAEKYPFVGKHAVLLPAAWGARIISYARDSSKKDRSAADAYRTGADRVKLLKYYGITD